MTTASNNCSTRSTGASELTEADAIRMALEITGRTPQAEHLEPVTKRAIVLRMLENLVGRSAEDRHRLRLGGYLDAILALAPTISNGA